MARKGKGVGPITAGLKALASDFHGAKLERTLKRIGEEVVAEIKRTVAKGISPISGKRFPAYKNPARYPGDRKPKRPVNLYLTGQMLGALAFRIKNGAIDIYLRGAKANAKEQGHRDGANGQPKRPIIPQGDETLTRGIQARVRAILRETFGKRRPKS